MGFTGSSDPPNVHRRTVCLCRCALLAKILRIHLGVDNSVPMIQDTFGMFRDLCPFALPAPHPRFTPEGTLSLSLSDFHTAAALSSLLAACAAISDASEGVQPYNTRCGLTTEGPTTDLYTELFGSRKKRRHPRQQTPCRKVPTNTGPWTSHRTRCPMDRRFRILAIVDDFTRECLALVADSSLRRARARCCDRHSELSGNDRSDNGPS